MCFCRFFSLFMVLISFICVSMLCNKLDQEKISADVEVFCKLSNYITQNGYLRKVDFSQGCETNIQRRTLQITRYTYLYIIVYMFTYRFHHCAFFRCHPACMGNG